VTTFDLGSGIRCDLSVLIDTRLLMQASSGGGKSWALRRLLEQSHGKVQQIVIDPEGEFQMFGAPAHPDDYTEACQAHVGALLGTPTWRGQPDTCWMVYEIATAGTPEGEVNDGPR
jgi:hypothetical protein